MSIKVKHEGNVTPGAFAASSGGQGKRAQQDAAQMSSVMQQAANAGNQQLRGATAPSAAPGRSSAQLLHAAAPVGSGGGGGGGRGGIANAYDEADAKMRLLEREHALRGEMYDKTHAGEMEKQNLLGKQNIDEIRMRGSEARGMDVWRQQNNVFAQGHVPGIGKENIGGIVSITPHVENEGNAPVDGNVVTNVQNDGVGSYIKPFTSLDWLSIFNPTAGEAVRSIMNNAGGGSLEEQFVQAMNTAQEAINNRDRGLPLPYQTHQNNPHGQRSVVRVNDGGVNDGGSGNALPKLPNGMIDFARMYANGVVNTTNSIFDIW